MELSPPFPGLDVREVRNPTELLKARRLHAACYVAADYVGRNQLSAEGTIDDPWVPFSDYLVAVDIDNDEIVGTARLVRPSIQGFPIARHGPLFEDVQEAFARLDPNLCIEISALATARKGLQNALISSALYRRLGQLALDQGRAYVFAVMDARLARFLRNSLLSPFEPIGPSRPERSQTTTPMAVYLPRALRHYLEQEPELLETYAAGRSFSEINQVEIDLRAKAPYDIRAMAESSRSSN